MPYLYKSTVEQYFSSTERDPEDILIIHTGDNWITASGENKNIYQPLLAQELGLYQSHRYIGWFADYTKWREGLSIPYTLMYEVTYANQVIQESFHFAGGMPARLQIREVVLPTL